MGLKIDRIILSVDARKEEVFNPLNGHTDVIVIMENQTKYIASFFAYKSISIIVDELKESGENLKGKFFWAKNMILIDECSKPHIETVIKRMICEGDFLQAFIKV